MGSWGDHHLLARLSDIDQTLAPGEQDVRGRQVLDDHGNELGTIDDLIIDLHERKVRLLRVRHGGILGLGSSAVFIPVEAISRVGSDQVWINLSQRQGEQAVYDPGTVDSDRFPDRFGQNGNPPFPLPGGLGPADPRPPETPWGPVEGPRHCGQTRRRDHNT